MNSLFVNGVEREVSSEEDTPLLYVLRNDLDLKATRFGCGNEQCGACLVLVDGKPACACTGSASTTVAVSPPSTTSCMGTDLWTQSRVDF